MKFRPIRAAQSVRALIRDRSDTRAGGALVGALTGQFWRRHAKDLREDFHGFEILEDRPNLPRLLSRREWLSSFEPDSLGRAYAEWTQGHGFTPFQLMADLGTRSRSIRDEEFLIVRSNAAHDLWHVVTGYGRDLRGEAALTHLMLLQYRSHTGMILPSMLALWWEGRPLWNEVSALHEQSKWLPAVRWEDMLQLPLTRVRAILGMPREGML